MTLAARRMASLAGSSCRYAEADCPLGDLAGLNLGTTRIERTTPAVATTWVCGGARGAISPLRSRSFEGGRWYGSGMDDERQHMHDNGALLAADGSPRLPHVGYDDDGYAYSDGAPLAQNDNQAVQLFYAFPALKALVRRRFPDAFAGCDMFVYPRRRSRGVAPDIFIAFGAGELDASTTRRRARTCRTCRRRTRRAKPRRIGRRLPSAV